MSSEKIVVLDVNGVILKRKTQLVSDYVKGLLYDNYISIEKYRKILKQVGKLKVRKFLTIEESTKNLIEMLKLENVTVEDFLKNDVLPSNKYGLNKELLEQISELSKTGEFRFFYFTNSNGYQIEKLIYNGYLVRMEGFTSKSYGYKKPAPGAYINFLKWLNEKHAVKNVDLFIDDKLKNVSAAIKHGIPSIKYRQNFKINEFFVK